MEDEDDDDEEDEDDDDAYDAMRPYNGGAMAVGTGSNESSPLRRGEGHQPQLDVSLPFIKNSSHPQNAVSTNQTGTPIISQ